MKPQEIYSILREGGLSRAGALGMLGNMQAESTLKPDIAQRGMTKLTDAQYTAAADNGLIDFVHDSVGYGLCQWTYHTRKKDLLEFARGSKSSVGDGVMQCHFCIYELKADYPELYQMLCESDDIDACSDKICNTYERPAVNNYLVRRNFAHMFESQTSDTAKPYTPQDPVSATFPPDATVLAFQLWMNYNGYSCEVNGYKSKEFFDTLDEFVADMKKC